MAELRQTVRRLFRAPGFTLTTVLTLGVAIGATIAIFSVVNGILLKPLPFPESDRLIALVHRSRDSTEMAASPAFYLTYREHSTTFESVALWHENTAAVTGAGEPEEVPRLMVTYELLATLGVQPLLGRAFTAADGERGAAGTVILSYAYWQRRFGGAENALGQTLVVDGVPREIVGVLPPDFRFTQPPPAIVTPDLLVGSAPFVPSSGERGVARLKEGVTLEEASADVARMIPIYLDSHPIVPGLTRAAVEAMQIGPNLRTLKDDIVGDLDEVLWVLMGTIAMLLLVACANVANLQLVRTEIRGRELAIRAALGAGRARIGRGLLAESVLLGIGGGVVGLVFAAIALPLLLSVAGDNLPAVLEVSIDGTVLAFVPAISLAAGLAFGLVSVLKHAGAPVPSRLGGAGRTSSASRERQRVRNALVVVQVALALVLLVGSGLMIRTFQSLRDVDPGFTEPHSVQMFRIFIPQREVPDFRQALRLENDIVDRLAEIPGVEAVGFSTRQLLGQFGPTGPFSLEDKPDAPPVSPVFRYASPGYFSAIGTPLLAGRSFEWSDHYGMQQVALVSETFARREWGSPAAALGKRLRRAPSTPWLEIVGVVGDVRMHGVDQPAPDALYLTASESVAQFVMRAVQFAVRSDRAGTPGFLREVEQAVWSVNANLPLGSVVTLGELYGRSMARTSLTLLLVGIAGAMALVLGLVGIYGVLSYVLAQRTREIGIRVALGARDGHIGRMLLGHLLRLVGAGVALGLGGAALLTRLMESLLFGVTALDPVTYVAVATLLIGTGALAGYLPARRATRIDPQAVLKAE
ncbi:MAG TPA: ABC transporter permease [Gammaproteobacteria bacterium]